MRAIRGLIWTACLPIAAASIADEARSQPAKPASKAALAGVEVRLFLETSGTLSPDILPLKSFGTWNFRTVGDSMPEDRFSSFLISLVFTAPGETFAKGVQARLRLVNQRTRKVVWTKSVGDLYIGPGGRMTHAVFVEDRACGPFRLIVSAGGVRMEHELAFNCGE